MERSQKEISVVIPLHNEEGNVEALYIRLKKVLDALGRDYEVIFIDDGSKDNTYQRLLEIYNKDSRINIIRLNENFGQGSSLSAGFNFVRGEIIVTMDGDLQHDPADIPKLLGKIYSGYDMVSGWKKNSFENFLTKRMPSLVVKKIIRFLFDINLHDISSTFKAYRSEILKDIKLSGELHRFIPLLVRKDASIYELEIRCGARKYGKSHYGLGRIKRVILDIVSLWRRRTDIKKHHPGFDYLFNEIKFHP